MQQEWIDYTYVDEAGTPHVFDNVVPSQNPSAGCIHPKLLGYALESSGMVLDLRSGDAHGVVILKDGTRITDATVLRKDANGNMVLNNGVPSAGEIDTLGRSVKHVVTNLPGQAPYQPTYEDWITQDSSGHDQRTRIEWGWYRCVRTSSGAGSATFAPAW